jgi:hypothetical protein
MPKVSLSAEIYASIITQFARIRVESPFVGAKKIWLTGILIV